MIAADGNRDLDVLASLPSFPHYVGLSDLCVDFAMARQADIVAVFERLRQRHGIEIDTVNVPIGGGRTCRIKRRSWDKAQQIAERYWTERYEGQPAPLLTVAGPDNGHGCPTAGGGDRDGAASRTLCG
jgi:hypothetical protein